MSARSRPTDVHGSAGAGSAHVARAGAYLTDEVFLYRVVARVAGGDDEMIDLEDCFRLDVVRVALEDLRARRLRVVRPARIEQG